MFLVFVVVLNMPCYFVFTLFGLQKITSTIPNPIQFKKKIKNTNSDGSQDLRSALESKAKKGGAASGGSRGRKRSMKRGQSKSLSDLPPLPT